VKPTYAAGLAKHLLEQSGRPDIATVETFGEAGAVGFHWPPCGVKVTFADGSAVFVSFTRASSMQGDDPGQADEFRPGT
jgi:hypothetical protein